MLTQEGMYDTQAHSRTSLPEFLAGIPATCQTRTIHRTTATERKQDTVSALAEFVPVAVLDLLGGSLSPASRLSASNVFLAAQQRFEMFA
jgi:hypothetical protein